MINTKTKIDRSNYFFNNKALAGLIIPLIIEQFLNIAVGMIAVVMVASVGEAAVSGVALVDNIMFLFIGLSAALSTGGAVIAGQYLGQKNLKSGREATDQMIWFNTILAIVIMIIIYACRNLILGHVFGPIEADVREHASRYLSIVTATLPFIALYNAGSAIFRAMGNSKLPMIVAVIMNIISISATMFFVFVLGLGTVGVGISILLSRIIAAIIISYRLFNTNQELCLSRTLRYKPDWVMIKRTLKIGIPNGFENSMFQLGKVVLLGLIASFGTYAITANAVSMSIAMFQILPGIAITLAITPITARCVGAGDYEQAEYYLKKLIGICIVAMAVINIIILLLIPTLLQLYNLSDVTAETTRQILVFHGITCIILWPIAFGVPSALRAAGDVKVVMIMSLVIVWVFRIGFSYLLARFFGLGVFGTWVAMIMDWVIRAIVMWLRYKSGKWKLIKSI